MNTPMVANGGSYTKKLFEDAPLVIKNQYNTNALNAIDSLMNKLSAEDPKLVVMAMKRLITANNPSLVNLTGIVAKVIGFSLNFPVLICDFFIGFVSGAVKPLPEVLAEIQKPRNV
jgi:hypothetical protein